jgi:hypothetical protein
MDHSNHWLREFAFALALHVNRAPRNSLSIDFFVVGLGEPRLGLPYFKRYWPSDQNRCKCPQVPLLVFPTKAPTFEPFLLRRKIEGKIPELPLSFV